MAMNDAGVLSNYRELTMINTEHGISLVQHIATDRVYVLKTLDVYKADIYRYLQANPVRGIPEIEEVIEHNGRLTIIEEYISGQTLRSILDNGNLFLERDAVRIIEELCGILKNLHGANPPIIHRDIKPDNIMLTPDGSIRLLDMDAARMIREKKSADTDLIGTVGYAAPEQYGFGTSDERTDIYSLGVVLCELVTGSLPKDKVPAGRLEKIIRKCTQIDPVNRYKNVQELQIALSVFNTGYRDDSVQSTWKKYAPPGFRSGKPANILISVFVYAALVSLSLGYTAEGLPPGPVTNVCRGIYLIMGLVMLFFTANYLDVWKIFRIDRIRNMWLRTIVVLAVDGILGILMILLMIFAAVSMGAYG